MLTIIKNDENNPRNAIYQCACGTVKSIRKSAVKSGSTKSCGCHRKKTAITNGKKATTHGLTNSFAYSKWRSLKRKFKLCKEWNDFKTFYDFFNDKIKMGVCIKDGFEELSEESVIFLDKNEAKQKKRKKTCLMKYGSESASKDSKVKEKTKKTVTERYGGHSSKSKIFHEKAKKTNLKKYGVEHPMLLDKYKEAARKKFALYDGQTTSDIAKKIGASKTTALNLVKKYGYEQALLYSKNETSIEIAIKNLLNDLNISFTYNKFIGNTRPDFLIQDYNLIIECDGLYWHSDAINQDKKYHRNKMLFYKNLNYRSLFFREDEIEQKFNAVKSIILNALKKCEKIYARKCKIIEMSNAETKEFFLKNHVMGHGKGKAFGLSYEGRMVAAMQITNKKDYIDISRFCTLSGISVIGGFSRLLKQIELEGKDISTFIDLRYGTGEYLPSLGFEKISEAISFKWVKDNKTYHRMKFPGNSGYEKGLYKIWDCGQARYVKKAPFGA